jgi:methionyl-tRNA formyltransferase
MRVVYLGTPEPAVPPLRALLASAHQVVAVVTRPDKPRTHARGRPAPSPVRRVADEAGLPVLTPARGRDPDFPGQLASLGADIGVTCAFGLLLPRPVLDAFPRGVINVHFSLLPAYRGAAPVQRALADGVTVTGVTTFQLDEGMDTGPMLHTAEAKVDPGEDAGALTARLADAGAALLVRTIDDLEAGTLTPRPQPAHGASLAPKVTAEEARLDFARPAARVVDAVRAFTPAPGAWTTLRGRRLKIRAATAVTPPDGVTLAPGELAATPGGLLAGATDGAVRLDVVQPDGRQPMPGADFARGLRPAPDERLGA